MDHPECSASLIRQLMSIAERPRHAGRDMARDGHRHGASKLAGTPDDRGQVLTINELHGHERRVIHLAHIKGADDVGVLQPDRQLRLVEEHRHVLGLVREAQ